MKKIYDALLFVSILSLFCIALSFNVSSLEDEEYGWVLVEIIDLDHEEDFEKYNAQYEDIYRYTGIYERNDFIITRSYIGDTDTSFDPPKIYGESMTFQGSFSQPPEMIALGENVTIQVRLGLIEDNRSFFTPFASVRAQMGNSNRGYWDFENEDGEGFFRTDSNNEYQSFDETVTTATPEFGSQGDELEIRLYLYSGLKLETWYIYEYQQLNETSEDSQDSSSEEDDFDQDSSDGNEGGTDDSNGENGNGAGNENTTNDSPGFEIIGLLATIAVAVILMKRKK
jgi:hypothetical protein